MMRGLADHLNDIYEKLHSAAFRGMLKLIEMGFVPDFITRVGIRHLLSLRLKDVRPLHTYFQ